MRAHDLHTLIFIISEYHLNDTIHNITELRHDA